MTKNLAEGLKASLLVMMVATLGACATTHKAEPAQTPAEGPAATAPAAEAPAASAEETKQSSMASSYEVARGDCLWTIAGQSQIYGNPYEWPLIYKANSGKITSGPDLIYPGQSFDIEHNASSADVDQAMHFAKTRGAWKLGVEGSADKRYLGGK
ncbi:MAG: LysM peptidoglycan-binding domain-containing protein [Acidiferrobacterales bacterium]